MKLPKLFIKIPFFIDVRMLPGDGFDDDAIEDRFKSVIVEQGETLINCLAYIDLNPVRAGMVNKPEDYRWCSLGYHVQTGNRQRFLSWNFRLEAFGVKARQARLRVYREFVYRKGQIGPWAENSRVSEFGDKKDSALSQVDRFGYRTRYFTDI